MNGLLKKLRVEDNLDGRDMSSLKASRYSELCESWNKVFLIRSTKYPEKVAELHALSFVHACTLIGWRPRQTELILESNEDKE